MSKKTCTCEKCVRCCHVKPGWFKHGEAERLAKNMGISLEDLFNRYLLVDYWEDWDDDNRYVLSPAVKGVTSGGKFPEDPRGVCVFLTKDGKCEIHELGKPFECREALACEGEFTSHENVSLSWVKHQSQIHKLLGDKG